MAAETALLATRSTRVTLLALAAGMGLSAPLWGFGERRFPLLPCWGEATLQTGILPLVMALGLACALLLGLWRPTRVGILPLLSILALLSLLDLNRLQPWVWFYLLLLGLLAFDASKAQTSLRWLLAAVYFWGGANKLTPYFAEDNFSWFCEIFEITSPLGQYPLLGYGAALFEVLLGVLLLFPLRKGWMKWIYLGFHGIVILLLLKAQWNYVVLPWNAAMAALVFLCFSEQKEAPGTRLAYGQMLVLGMAWLGPLLGLFQLWPYQFCWQLYSNTQPEAVFYSPQPCEGIKELWMEKSFDHGRRFLLDDWSTADIQVPMFYSDHTFGQMRRYLCRCVAQPDDSKLLVLRVHPWNKAADESWSFSCSGQKTEWEE